MLQTTAAQRKAVFIDGQSANRSKQALGIALVNFAALYRILVHEVGVCRELAFEPIVTAHPDRMNPGEGFAKLLAGAGFKLVPVTSKEGADDRYLIDRIEALDAAAVREIVILTSDKDFLPVLRCKASQGIQIHWVSTFKPTPGRERSSIPQAMYDLVKSGEFCFTDLADYREKITLKGRCPKEHVTCTSDSSYSKITLALKNNNPQKHLDLVNELQRIKGKFPGLTIAIDC